MVDRIQLTKATYMRLDGLWQIADVGCVMDVPLASAFHPSTAVVLSPAEAAGTLASHGLPTPVRNIRNK